MNNKGYSSMRQIYLAVFSVFITILFVAVAKVLCKLAGADAMRHRSTILVLSLLGFIIILGVIFVLDAKLSYRELRDNTSYEVIKFELVDAERHVFRLYYIDSGIEKTITVSEEDLLFLPSINLEEIMDEEKDKLTFRHEFGRSIIPNKSLNYALRMALSY